MSLRHSTNTPASPLRYIIIWQDLCHTASLPICQNQRRHHNTHGRQQNVIKCVSSRAAMRPLWHFWAIILLWFSNSEDYCVAVEHPTHQANPKSERPCTQRDTMASNSPDENEALSPDDTSAMVAKSITIPKKPRKRRKRNKSRHSRTCPSTGDKKRRSTQPKPPKSTSEPRAPVQKHDTKSIRLRKLLLTDHNSSGWWKAAGNPTEHQASREDERRFTCKGDRLRENCDGYYNPQNLSLSAATHRVGCCDPLRGEIFWGRLFSVG
jgi:hypothetical protein